MVAPLTSPERRLRRIEGFRIEPATHPVEHLLVLLVVGILNRLHEFGVAPDAATVLGRTGPFALQAPRIPLPPLGQDASLEKNIVPPRITEVILVLEPKPLAGLR